MVEWMVDMRDAYSAASMVGMLDAAKVDLTADLRAGCWAGRTEQPQVALME